MPLKRVSSSVGLLLRKGAPGRRESNASSAAAAAAAVRNSHSTSALSRPPRKKRLSFSSKNSAGANGKANADWGFSLGEEKSEEKVPAEIPTSIAEAIPSVLEDEISDFAKSDQQQLKQHGDAAMLPEMQQIQMRQVQEKQMRRMEETQRRTISVLAELNDSIQDLRHVIANNKSNGVAPPPQSQSGSPGTPQRRRGSGRLSIGSSGGDPYDYDVDPDDGLDRKMVRLDGLEVYAVVSAVTAGTLVAVFDSYHPGDIVDLFSEGRYLDVFMSCVFLFTGAIGIVCGLHCIFVFSLITMYARTALGMDRDDALEEFFGTTGLQRYHGFQTFVGSLYALMCELIVVITAKISSNSVVHLVALVVATRLMYYVWVDTQTIMEKAGVIFAPPKEVEEDLEEEDDENDGDYWPSGSDRRLSSVGETSDMSVTEEEGKDGGKRMFNRRLSLKKRGSTMSVPATSLMNVGSGGGGGGGSQRPSSPDLPSSHASVTDDDDDGLHTSHHSSGRYGGGKRANRRNSLQRRGSTMNVAATDLLNVRERRGSGSGRGGSRRGMLKHNKQQSTMNMAATDLLKSR
eukprot:CAMPEP_0185806494 /NCGR_PEP_ID=MMETSP1322-20130828/4464_1 /TAXON_ID=265543 /ORGANISM="Minutocellus polymorphus, Strain RCC2270" /LENGTH=571 /DNA_ID=CAMNT_0028502583 /DNA_START=150 /DNA_END=1865 /DNA_ORIENTATION=-